MMKLLLLLRMLKKGSPVPLMVSGEGLAPVRSSALPILLPVGLRESAGLAGGSGPYSPLSSCPWWSPASVASAAASAPASSTAAVAGDEHCADIFEFTHNQKKIKPQIIMLP